MRNPYRNKRKQTNKTNKRINEGKYLKIIIGKQEKKNTEGIQNLNFPK